MNKTETVVALIPSDRTPGKEYRIFYDSETKIHSCECWDYIVRRKAEGTDCKHIRSYKEAEAELEKQAKQSSRKKK